MGVTEFFFELNYIERQFSAILKRSCHRNHVNYFYIVTVYDAQNVFLCMAFSFILIPKYLCTWFWVSNLHFPLFKKLYGCLLKEESSRANGAYVKLNRLKFVQFLFSFFCYFFVYPFFAPVSQLNQYQQYHCETFVCLGEIFLVWSNWKKDCSLFP